jgi:cell division protein FtsW
MRWLSLGPLNLQPSEPMKLAMVLYLAGYLVRRGELVRSTMGGFLRPMSMLAVIGVLLLFEPDYGATVVLFTTALGMLFLGGVPFWSFVGWAAFVAVSMAVVVMTAPYRVERMLTFLNPWADPFGSGFQLTQALIAIGSGEWFGVGLGSSVQKLFYLPEAHTDFLFAVLAEELGMLGVLVVILLFTFVVWRAIAIGTRAEHAGHAYGAHLAYGVALLIGLQAFVNIGVNMGILPTKGLTLPLMSYGGSSLLVNSFAVGLVMRVDHELRRRA